MCPNYNPEEFEKMKKSLIEQGFNWDKGWAFLPFMFAGNMFFNKKDNERNE